GSRYQWFILGYPSISTWWNEPTDCSMQEIIRAINGTLQTRVSQKDYFDAYVYDTIWSLAYLYQSHLLSNQSIIGIFKNVLENIDFIGATGRIRYLNGGRIGEVLVEQFVACRMMKDKTCRIPCYEEEDDCH
ncbi:unnamed protein product, partial [Rotaria sordida]